MQKTTHFGYQEVPIDEKVSRVGEVFRSVAGNYDIMNDVMSLGMHRVWKRIFCTMAKAKPGDTVLDLAAGTGDITEKMARSVGERGHVVSSDINEAMLAQGRKRLLDIGCISHISFVQANAEELPFEDDHFDIVTMSFGLRNVTDQNKALREMYRVLKPGGKALVLEFSKPAHAWLETLYDQYSFKLIPKLGEWIANDKDSYQYLVESIRMHPTQEVLKSMFLGAGFDQADYFNMMGGIVAIHRGIKW